MSANPRLDALADEWLQTRRPHGAPNSHAARTQDLYRFATAATGALDRPVPIDTNPLHQLAAIDLTTLLVNAALLDMAETYRYATVARTLSTLRSWTRWLHRHGHLTVDPCDDEDVRVPRATSVDPSPEPVHAFATDEVAAMLRAAADPSPTARSAWATRDVAVLSLLASCGLRASELVALQVRHFDTRFDFVIVRLVAGTKGGTVRDVPVPRPTWARLETYNAERTQRFGTPRATDRFFVRVNSRPFDRGFLDRLVRRVAAAAGVTTPPDSCTHAFRHHAGVELSQRIPLSTLQQLLGHRDSKTTSIYTRTTSHSLAAQLFDAGWL